MSTKLKALFLACISLGMLAGCSKKEEEKKAETETHKSIEQLSQEAIGMCKGSSAEVCQAVVTFKAHLDVKEDEQAGNALAGASKLCQGYQTKLCDVVKEIKVKWDDEHKEDAAAGKPEEKSESAPEAKGADGQAQSHSNNTSN